MRKIVSAIFLTLLLAVSILLVFNIRPAAAAITVYINSDGSVTPISAPISSSDNITYTLTGNINYPDYDGIVIGKSNTVINGNGHTVQGAPVNDTENGIDLTDTNNITIKNINLHQFQYAIILSNTNNATITGNTLTGNSQGGVFLAYSVNNTITGNNASLNGYIGILLDYSSFNTVNNNVASANNFTGIYLFYSATYNTVIGNNATSSTYGILSYSSTNNIITANNASANSMIGIRLDTSSNFNTVSENTASANKLYGIYLSQTSNNNTIRGNTISNNDPYGLALQTSSNNTIYHNDFVANTHQIWIADSNSTNNTWDKGYPTGGNYWRDYNGTDTHSGPYQNITGSDGIGDIPYTIDANNTDHYPLIGSYGPSTHTGLNVTVFPTENISLTYQEVTTAGSTIVHTTPTYAPPLSNIIGPYYEVLVNATFTGNVTVRIIFDGSNLTQQQKSNLTMMQYTPLIADVSGPRAGVSDGVVNMRDIAYIILHFATTPNSPNWDPRYDIYGPTGAPDGVVNMRDIAFAVTCFGQTSHWTNITSYVDTANNVIYGQTTHFSFIGIH